MTGVSASDTGFLSTGLRHPELVNLKYVTNFRFGWHVNPYLGGVDSLLMNAIDPARTGRVPAAAGLKYRPFKQLAINSDLQRTNETQTF